MNRVVLVPPDRYSSEIKTLIITKRISTDYPVLVRDKVAKMLSNVVENLPDGYLLQIDSGYRDRKTQEKIYAIREKQARKNRELKDLVFDPKKGTPPHTTGGAVDISLLDKSGREINLSAPFEKYYIEPQLRSKNISKKSQKLRLMLNKLFIDEGFSSNDKEYWHFSYGDGDWANKKSKKAIYGEVDISDVSLYPPHLRILYRIIRVIYRILNKILKIDTHY